MKAWLVVAALMVAVLPAQAQEPDSQRQALIARAKSLELNTPYIPPPAGSPLEHFAAGFAKVMCSAVFITGLEPEFAAENVGFFTAPHKNRAKVDKPVVDRNRKSSSEGESAPPDCGWRSGLRSGARGRAFESRRAHSGTSSPACTSVRRGFRFPTHGI